MKSTKVSLLFLILIIIASRIFFLDAGCGAEEDAWGVRLAAKHIAQTGQYEASRLPGHPLQELVYAAIVYKTGIIGMNALTAFFSVIACIFFFLILRDSKFIDPIFGTLALAFTPIVYMHSTDCMDYIWALAFILMGYYWMLKDKNILAGIMLGMAIGCRITSGVLIIPFIIHLVYFRKHNWKNIFVFLLFAFMTSGVIFIPVIQKYGGGFFHYYDQFPYPSFGKLFYKGTFGVWGSLGCCSIIILLFFMLVNFKRTGIIFDAFIKNFATLMMVIILYAGLYFMLPQKSAYLIPIVPFVIMLAGQFSPKMLFRAFVIMTIISSFFFGINLSDKTRGANPSCMTKTLVLGGQEVHLDLLHGPVIDDFLKRKARMDFTNKIIETTSQFTAKSIVISGWWLNPVLDELNDKKQGNVKFVYCMDEPEIKEKLAKGFAILYLPEMDSINDLRYKITVTKQLAKPLFD